MRLDVVEGEGRALMTLPPLAPDDTSPRLGDMAQAVELALRLAARKDRLTSA